MDYRCIYTALYELKNVEMNKEIEKLLKKAIKNKDKKLLRYLYVFLTQTISQRISDNNRKKIIKYYRLITKSYHKLLSLFFYMLSLQLNPDSIRR
jgi:hypothetical protein